MNKYVFVVRGYNDLDNFTPLIDYLAKEKLAKVYLYSSINNLFFENIFIEEW